MMNPLREYFDKEDSMSVKQAEEATGVTSNTLRSISRMPGADVRGIQLGTYLVIRDVLGVDMIPYVEEVDISNVEV